MLGSSSHSASEYTSRVIKGMVVEQIHAVSQAGETYARYIEAKELAKAAEMEAQTKDAEGESKKDK